MAWLVAAVGALVGSAARFDLAAQPRYRVFMDDNAPYRRDDRSEFRRSSGRESEPLDQRLDRWVSAGRQFVDGVAGSRPGSRPTARGSEARGMGRGSEARTAGRGGFDGLGRWVEERLDWLLEDGDDWREPWQDSGPRSPSPAMGSPNPRNPSNPGTRSEPADRRQASSLSGAASPLPPTNRFSADQPRSPSSNSAMATDSAPRRRLEALSRRGLAPQPAAAAADSEAWPDDDSFSLPHWQRPTAAGRVPEPEPPAADTFDASGRPLPRSSRRASRRP